ncbi:MAG: O-antigen ligase domain-containing protein [Leptolyngbyaceae cyanobacterium bins.302]|nr:O-antigen ligase domain-containing protein [Leptolyngbyaceae cyanobacterium bins.302]
MMPAGNALVLIAMYAWIPFVLYIYLKYPAQRAVIICFIVATLFLPVAAIVLPGLPDYTKMTATSYGVLLATAIYDSNRFSQFKLSWIDTPMILWITVSPFMSSITNDLGPYDGFSTALTQSVTWGAPYFLGRLYLGSLEGLKQLAIGIFAWSLIYVPFCWYEARTFSSLHVLVYGINTGREAAQSIRYGGYRPQVFMEHGLMLGVWLMTGCMMGIVLWRTGIIKKMWNLPMGTLMAILLLTFIISRSTGAYGLFLMGVVILFVGWQFRNTLLLWVLILGICYYLYLGASGTFPNKPLIATLSQVFNADRVASLQFRFDNEEILGAKARQRMLFGWGGFGRNRIFNEMGEDVTVTDSLWIIAFGINGVFGLASMTAAILLPPIVFLIRYPAKFWKNPNVAPAAAIAICIVLYMLDCVLNAMVNPIFMLAGGGLATMVIQPKRVTEAQMKRPVRQLAGSS